jgi:hypothetical protein
MKNIQRVVTIRKGKGCLESTISINNGYSAHKIHTIRFTIKVQIGASKVAVRRQNIEIRTQHI